MGQYFIGVNLTKQVYVKPNGCLKLMEHAWMLNNSVNSFEETLEQPCRVQWCGDYGDVNDSLDGTNLYYFAQDQFVEIKVRETEKGEKRYRYLINHTTNQFVDKDEMPKDKDGWQIHPLPLLTTLDNHSGGSYHEERGEELIGTWANHLISVSNEKPDETFTQIFPDFCEE